MNNKDRQKIAAAIIDMTKQAKTTEDLFDTLHAIAFTLGGMACHFEQDDRTGVIISMTEAIGHGLMNTSESLGDACNLEIIVGKKSG